ncbi:hypothetical protein B9Z55_028739 [Caenorhabditis nigoni]|uniref:Uncharacterized protein n=1 Tax=Caenorhabditis nigoni TaxID=1611254 RepID=A0A2G5SAJ9_9PELO|nr:hypothetical protein B9Z55_028739 [Caenorhabditis nigoni]
MEKVNDSKMTEDELKTFVHLLKTNIFDDSSDEHVLEEHGHPSGNKSSHGGFHVFSFHLCDICQPFFFTFFTFLLSFSLLPFLVMYLGCGSATFGQKLRGVRLLVGSWSASGRKLGNGRLLVGS